MTIAVKSHGFTTGNFSLKAVDEKTSNSVRRLHNHMKEFNSTAIVLIRNPFKAIIGHRHLDEGGHTGHAKAGSFIGKGKSKYDFKKLTFLKLKKMNEEYVCLVLLQVPKNFGLVKKFWARPKIDVHFVLHQKMISIQQI
jgi:hypothetical protein